MEFQSGTKSTSWTALGNADTRLQQNSTTVLQLPRRIQIFTTSLENSKIIFGTQLMPSHHLEGQFENCKTKNMFATEKLLGALRWKKVRTQATKHLSEANFWTSELMHSNIHKSKGDKDHFGSSNDLLEDLGCRYLILIPAQYVYNFYQKTEKNSVPKTPNNEKSHNIKTACIHPAALLPMQLRRPYGQK